MSAKEVAALEITDRLEAIEGRVRRLFSMFKEEHDWTMHMILDLRKRLDEKEGK